MTRISRYIETILLTIGVICAAASLCVRGPDVKPLMAPPIFGSKFDYKQGVIESTYSEYSFGFIDAGVEESKEGAKHANERLIPRGVVKTPDWAAVISQSDDVLFVVSRNTLPPSRILGLPRFLIISSMVFVLAAIVWRVILSRRF